VSNSRGKDAIVGISDRNGARVGDEASVFLWNEEEKTVVKTRGRVLAPTKRLEDSKEKRSSEVGSSSPSGKRNAVGARRGVVGAFNSRKNRLKAGGDKERRVYLFIIIFVEEIRPFRAARRRRAESPNLGPVLAGNLCFARFVGGGSVGRKSAERGNASFRTGKFFFERSDGMRRGSTRRRRRRKKKCLGGVFKTVVEPSLPIEQKKAREGGIEGKNTINTGRVLERRGEKPEKGDVLRNK
jgi:hypothetical protein